MFHAVLIEIATRRRKVILSNRRSVQQAAELDYAFDEGVQLVGEEAIRGYATGPLIGPWTAGPRVCIMSGKGTPDATPLLFRSAGRRWMAHMLNSCALTYPPGGGSMRECQATRVLLAL